MSQKAKTIWTLLIVGVLLTPIGYWFLRDSPERRSIENEESRRPEEPGIGEWLSTLREFDGYEYYHFFRLHIPLGREGEWPEKMDIVKKCIRALCAKHGMKVSPMLTLDGPYRIDLLCATDRLVSDPLFPSEEWSRLMGRVKGEAATGSPESWFYISSMGSARILRLEGHRR